VQRLTATEASRRFSGLLDAVEIRGETFVVVRRGKVVATISPAARASGTRLKEVLRRSPPDAAWAAELRELRDSLAPDTDPWSG